RPVGNNDRDRFFWLQSQTMLARSVRAHELCSRSPAPRLQDAEILMPKRRTAAKLRGISRQQLGERVKGSANGHVGLYPKPARWFAPAYCALRPSGSSHTACVLYITADRKSYKSRLDRSEPLGGYQLV